MDAGLAQLRTDAPALLAQRTGHSPGIPRVAAVGEPFPKNLIGHLRARRSPMIVMARNGALAVVDPQVFRKRTHFSCIYRNRKIISDDRSLWAAGPGIRSTDTVVEKEKA